MHRLLLMLLALVALTPWASFAGSGIKSELVVGGLTAAIYVDSPPGDTERLFVVNRHGIISIVKNGVLLPSPFLDIQTLVEDEENLEKGLLGLAFHPDYANNGHFFVYYTTGPPPLNRVSVVHRFTVTTNPDSADASSLFPIFQVDQPTEQHNGGTIVFGPEGNLWLGLGDSNRPGRAEDGLEPLGKILRIDVDGDDFPADSLQNYAIPANNPYVGNANFLDEVWALGLRNPYRFSLDALTNDVYVADVGKDLAEEVSFLPFPSAAGADLGWPSMEGSVCVTPPTNCNMSGAFTEPVYDYPHDGFNCHAVTGGIVYRGTEIPHIQGRYFFADYCQPEPNFFSFVMSGGSMTDFRVHPELQFQSVLRVASINYGGDGEMYWTDGRENNGALYRVVADTAAVNVSLPPASAASFELAPPRPNPFQKSVQFSIRFDRATSFRAAIYSTTGRLVRELHNGVVSAGSFSVNWTGLDTKNRRAPAGVYFLRAQAGGEVRTQRVTLMP